MRSRYFAAAGIGLAGVLLTPDIAQAQMSTQTLPSATHGVPASSEGLLPVSYSLAATDTAAESAPESQPLSLVSTDHTNAKWKATQDAALKWEIGYLALSAIDAGLTIQCLNSGSCEERNPLYGKNPSTGTIIAAKAGLGVAHYLLFNYLNQRNPKMALRAAQISVGLQGAVVVIGTAF